MFLMFPRPVINVPLDIKCYTVSKSDSTQGSICYGLYQKRNY